MVKNVDTNKAEKLNQILVAAQKRFAHYGLLKTSMNDIARDIGMSKASLYYYFMDKEAIFQEVIKKEQQEFISQIEKITEQKENASELLVVYVKKRLVYFQELLNLGKLNSDTMKSVKPVYAELFQQFKDKETGLIKSIIKKGTKNGEFAKVNAGEYADLFILIIQSLRSCMILKKGLENFDNKDFQVLEKQYVSVAKIFSKGIKK